MSAITLEMLQNAAVATLPDATPAQQGDLIAQLAVQFAGEMSPVEPVKAKRTRKPKAVKKAATIDPTIGSGAALAPNWNGQMMKSAKGSASNGQVKYLVSNGVKPAKAKAMSMVEASNLRAKLSGKIA